MPAEKQDMPHLGEKKFKSSCRSLLLILGLIASHQPSRPNQWKIDGLDKAALWIKNTTSNFHISGTCIIIGIKYDVDRITRVFRDLR